MPESKTLNGSYIILYSHLTFFVHNLIITIEHSENYNTMGSCVPLCVEQLTPVLQRDTPEFNEECAMEGRITSISRLRLS